MTTRSLLFQTPINSLRSHLTRCAILASCLSFPPAADAAAESGGMTSGAWQASLGATDLGLNGSVRDLLSDGGSRCYLAGTFTSPGHCVSYWNGAAYENVGTAAWIGESSANDLATLLAAWGTVNAEIDLTGDALIDGADLATLLAAWGPCDDEESIVD